jgi:hypothetical protein
MYESLKNKFVLFSSGQLAFLGYIYSSVNSKAEINTIKRLFIPTELSSQIFYAIGVVLALLSLALLFQGFLPADWNVPPQSKDLKKLKFDSKKNLLVYLRDEYYDAIRQNGSVFESKNVIYRKGLVCLVIGDVILFVIRFFGSIST